MASKFTCFNCRVAFLDADFQRQHYKTDWHRYNLKRKVADLPPVSAEEFQRRVLQQREQDESLGKDNSVFCNVCHKSFNGLKSFENHLKSKKHLNLAERNSIVEDGSLSSISTSENKIISDKSTNSCRKSSKTHNVSISDDDSSIEEIDSDEWDEDFNEDNPVLRNDCLFCTHHSASMTKSLKHMTVAHSFFIPDIEYVTDLKGLLCYLGEKISSGYMCLWCNDSGRTFLSKEAAQQHMVDKGHCKMLHEAETLLEYSDYYDYRRSYPDYNDESKTSGSEELDEINIPIIEGGDFQLVLPSGAVIGHRSLMRYYRQNFDPNKALVPVQKKMNHIISQYRALGWTGTEKQAVAKKVRDLKFIQRVWSKNNMKLGVKANKLSIKRPQVNF